MKDSAHFNKLFENTVMLLGNIFEDSYCINKITKEEVGIFKFNYDPSCGLVGKYNDWCLVGGEVLVLKTWFDDSLRIIKGLNDIQDLRLIDDYKVHVLTDPWSEESSVWELEINPQNPNSPITILKLRDFKDYIDKPYSDIIQW
jgi:hypothetical protein